MSCPVVLALVVFIEWMDEEVDMLVIEKHFSAVTIIRRFFLLCTTSGSDSVSAVICPLIHISNLCMFTPAGCVCDSYLSLRHAVGPAGQRSDAARSVDGDQVLPLPGHVPSL